MTSNPFDPSTFLNARGAAAPMPSRPSRPGFLHRVETSIVSLGIAVVALGARQHFLLTGQSTPALVSLVVAAVCVLMPVRAILARGLGLAGRGLHLAHGVGSLAFVGLSMGGVVTGAPLVSHAALAPFAIMGAAQAIMHQNHPRNARQAAALRDFATSLPEVAAFTSSPDLTSPANAARAVRVLGDLVSKAQVLGETELEADPEFQSAWSRATTHAGLTLGLDAIDQAIGKLAANPATASAVPGLRTRLEAARRTVAAAGWSSGAPGVGVPIAPPPTGAHATRSTRAK